MEEKKYTSIKEFGFDPEILKKQNESYKTEKDKYEHYKRVLSIIDKVRYDIRIVIRYLYLIEKELTKIIGGRSFKVEKKQFDGIIRKIKTNELSKRDIDDAFHQLIKEKKLLLIKVFYNAKGKLIDKFYQKENGILILDIITKKYDEYEVEAQLTILIKELKEKKKEFNPVAIWLERELTKYRNITTLSYEISENNKTDSKLRNFKHGELKKELIKSIKELNLKQGVSVESKVIIKITNRLIKNGWNANKDSVGVVLRNMGYVEGKRM